VDRGGDHFEGAHPHDRISEAPGGDRGGPAGAA
jgi:hypothetical protein